MCRAETSRRRHTSCSWFLIGETLTGSIEKGAINLWLILWHTLMLALIGRTAEGTAIHLDSVWKMTIRKFADMAFSAAHTADMIRIRHISRGIDPPTEYPKQNRILAPLAIVDESAQIRWSDKMRKELQDLDLPGYIPTPTPESQNTSRPTLAGIKFVKGTTP